MGTGATVQTDPAVAQQKVASAPNPEAIKVKTLPKLSSKIQLYNPKTSNPTDYIFQASPLPQNNVMKGLSSEMQPPVTVYTPALGDHFGYSQSTDNTRIKAWWNDRKPKVRVSDRGTPISDFADDVDNLISLGDEVTLVLGLNIAYFVAVMFIAATCPEAIVIAHAVKSLGIVGGLDVMAVVKTIISYYNLDRKCRSDFNSI